METEFLRLFEFRVPNSVLRAEEPMPNKMKEFRGMSDEQLTLTLKETEKHLFQLRFQSATDRLETPSEIRKAKQDIARVKTLQREKELVELEAAAAGPTGDAHRGASREGGRQRPRQADRAPAAATA